MGQVDLDRTLPEAGSTPGDLAGPPRHRGMLPRLRRSFAGFTALVALGGLTQLGMVPAYHRPLAVVGLLGVVAWAGLMSATRCPWWLDLLALAPLSAVAVAVGGWWVIFPLVHVVIFQRALHGDTVRAYAGAAVIGGLPLALAMTAAGTTPGWPHLVLLPSLAVSTWLLRQVRLLAEQVERSARRERRLLVASRQMAAAADQQGVDGAVTAAALDLLEQPQGASTLWEERDDAWAAVASAGPSRLTAAPKPRLSGEMVGRAAIGEPWVLTRDQAAELQARLGLAPRFEAFVFVPLPRPHGPRAVLGLSCPARPDPGLADALRRFAQEIALAEERARLVAEVADREARLASILEGSADIIAQLDAEGRFTMINQATSRVHGYDPDELIGRNVFDLIVEEDRGYVLRTSLAGDLDAGINLAHRLYDADGNVREVESRLSRPHPGSSDFILNTRDVTERTALEEEIVYRAHHDAMTGLANRGAFTERLEESLARAERHQVPMGLLVLDLNEFKPVNDTYGHHAGDRVLIEIAQRLRDDIRTTDLAARVGGDEFAVILEDAGDPGEVAGLARRLESALAEPITLPAGQRIRVSASVGVATSRPDSDPDGLLREADQHLYASKRARQGAEPGTRSGPSESVGDGPHVRAQPAR